MNCQQCRSLFVEASEDLLAPDVRSEFEAHLRQCPECEAEMAGIALLSTRLDAAGSAARHQSSNSLIASAVMANLVHLKPIVFTWSTIMKLTIPLTVTAVAATIVLTTIIWHDNYSQASGQQLLDDAAKAMQNVNNLHITARMRTAPAENPGEIDVNSDFIPIEIFKRVAPDGKLQWRFDKSQRVIAMDGKSTRIWIAPIQAAVVLPPGNIGDLDWLGGLLQLGDTLKNEQQHARMSGDQLKVTQEVSADDRQITVLTIESKSRSLHGNDWLKDRSLETSNTRRVYRFDTESKRFEGLQIWVHPDNQDEVLVFETTAVEYPDQIPDAKFTIDLSAGVQWQQFEAATTQPVAPEFSKSRKPDEIARAFFEALSAGDKDHFEQFWQVKMAFPDAVFKAYTGLKIISIGKPIRGFSNHQWFVPYQIQLASGATRSSRLSVRNDNRPQRWYVDGGF